MTAINDEDGRGEVRSRVTEEPGDASRGTSRLGSIALALVLAAVGVLASPALTAAANTTSHQGGTVQHEQRGFADVFPCREDLGFFFFLATYNQQEHATDGSNGTRYTFTQVGKVTAYPIEVERDANGDPVYDENGDIIPIVDADGIPVQQAGETFSGHFQTSFGSRENPNVSTESFTLDIQGIGSEGTRLVSHENGHVTTDGPGDPNDPATSVKVAFDKVSCP